MSEERVEAELRRIRDDVRRRSLEETVTLPEARPTRAPAAPEPLVPVESVPPPEPPDRGPVNELWAAEAVPGGGLGGALRRLLDRLLGPRLAAQRAFNARQVQLDNELVAWIDARFAATHAHYDRVLGGVGRHLGEADERHLILQEELVAHVHDLVRRVDLVLAEGEKGRASLGFALLDLKTRLERLEERIARG
jgi:hypothetical protein